MNTECDCYDARIAILHLNRAKMLINIQVTCMKCGKMWGIGE